MKNLISKLAGIGLGIVLLTGMGGCATTNPSYRDYRQKLEENNMREVSFSQDGISAYVSPFGFEHIEE